MTAKSAASAPVVTGFDGKDRSTSRLEALRGRLSLSQKFLVASSLAIMAAMILVGSWVSDRIESAVTQNAAIDATLYVESVIGDRIQGLADSPAFDPAVQRDLERLVLTTPLGRRIVSFKVWAKGGRVVYASSPDHLGRTYEPTPNLEAAWRGAAKFEFDRLHDDEDHVEHKLNLPLVEIYVPVRKHRSDEVFAVVEFYEDATSLMVDLTRASRQAWLLLAGIGAVVVAALYGMARRASNTIDTQQAQLNHRITDLSSLLAQNLTLRQRVEASSNRAAVLNERYLRRIGSDLHDGPAQMISLALLRLDALPTSRGEVIDTEKVKIRSALEHALKDIRDLSIGLSAPELDDKSLTAVITEAVKEHEHRAECRVVLDIESLPAVAPREIKLAVFRFLQEGLNNARRHAAGADLRVAAKAPGGDTIEIVIADDGPGFDPEAAARTDRLGLAGMRERIESLGGTFRITSAPGQGTRLEAVLRLAQGYSHDT